MIGWHVFCGGGSSYQWVYSRSEGSSGGLCCIWNKDVFVRRSMWGDKGLLGVFGLWYDQPVNIVNVYGPCDVAGNA